MTRWFFVRVWCVFFWGLVFSVFLWFLFCGVNVLSFFVVVSLEFWECDYGL